MKLIGLVLQVLGALVAITAIASLGWGLGAVETIALFAVAVALFLGGYKLRGSPRSPARAP